MRTTLALAFLAASAHAAPHQLSVCASGCTHTNLQTAIQAAASLQDTAACKETIVEVRAGETFTGLFTLPAKSCRHYIRLRSSRLRELPRDKRVTPADAPLMPKLISPPGNTGATLITAQATGTGYWALEGLEITQPDLGAVTKYVLAGIGWASNQENTIARLPHHIAIDRSYLHGVPMREGPVRCLGIHGKNIWLTNSYLADCKSGNTDAQAIWMGHALGPVVVTNTYLEGSTENFLTGGASGQGNSIIAVTGYAQRDLRFVGNHFAKQAAWRRTAAAGIPTRICMPGEWQRDTETNLWYTCAEASGVWTLSPIAPTAFSVKNIFELKDGQGVLVYGNVLQRSWESGQAGAAFLINQSGLTSNFVVRDFRVEANRIDEVNAGFSMGNLSSELIRPQGVRIEDNLFTNSPAPYLRTNALTSRFLGYHVADDTVYRHNTMHSHPGAASWGVITSNDDVPPSLGGMNYIGESVFDRWAAGVHLFSGAADTHCFFRNVFTGFRGASDERKNAFAGTGAIGDNCTGGNGPRFPAGTALAANMSQILQDPANGNFRINSAFTAGIGTALDGRDLGADIDRVEWATATSISGDPNPFLRFRKRGQIATASGATIYFTAPTGAVCTASASLSPQLTPVAATAVVSRTGLSATAEFSGLDPGTRYFHSIECGVWRLSSEFRTRP